MSSNARPVLVVGFIGPALASLRGRPDRTVVFVEEPDLLRDGDRAATITGSPLVRELIPYEYQLPGAADRFAAEYAARHPGERPAAVIPLVEYGTPFAARLAELFGLPGAGRRAAETLRDKEKLRAVSRAAGIANPASRRIDGPVGLWEFLAEHGGPVVLKPANRQASVGTRVVTAADDLARVWAECTAAGEGAQVPDRGLPLRMLAEQYLSGPEYSVELLVRNGATVFANVTGKDLFPGPVPVERGHQVPAAIPAELAGLLVRRTGQVVAAVGFGTGTVHCEWIVVGGEPHLVECAGRLAGDGIAELVERAYLFPLVESYYALLANEDPPEDPPRTALRAAAVRFLTTEPGRVTAITGLDAARAEPGVLRCHLDVAAGDPVAPLRSSWDRIGHVLAVARTPAEARRAADTAAAHLRIATDGAAPEAAGAASGASVTPPSPR